MLPPHLTILGGGVCGLYAAHTALQAQAQVTLFEKENHFGGLAAGHNIDGNWFDLGVHMLHAFDQEIFATCQDAMGNERLEVPLKSHIKWGGKLYHYPLRGRDILAGIPPLTLARCLTGLLLAELESRFPSRPPGTDAESALIELYGTPLYEFFFEQFTHRYWGLHPRELSAEFVRRKMPRLSAVDVFKNLFQVLRLAKPRDTTEGALRFETLHYSPTGSETLPRTLAASLQSRGATLLPNSSITKINHQNFEIQSIETQPSQLDAQASEFDLRGSKLLSTLPLPLLIQLLSPSPPPAILAA
ncbi:MAG: NAD(P)-binding protein, partial [Verrucomicrobiota bacterium]